MHDSWCLPWGYWGNSDEDIDVQLLLLFIVEQNQFKHPLVEGPSVVCLDLLSLSVVSSGSCFQVAEVPVSHGAESWVCLWDLLSLVFLVSCWQLNPEHLSSCDIGNLFWFMVLDPVLSFSAATPYE